MDATLREMSEILADVRFPSKRKRPNWHNLKGSISVSAPATLEDKIQGSVWPLRERLCAMRNREDLWQHILLVLASVNDLIECAVKEWPLEFASVRGWDEIAKTGFSEALKCSWSGKTGGAPPLLGQDSEFSHAFLRVAALYHDTGKLIAADHHVPRGVHLMRDVSDQGRREIEGLFDTLSQRRCFWSLLRHHDVFGVLNTGEASTAAFSSVVGRTIPESTGYDPADSPSAHVSYMLWLNVADSNGSLIGKIHTALPSLEAARYFGDFTGLIESLKQSARTSRAPARDAFRTWSLGVSSHPSQAVQRIGRLVSSSYRMQSQRCPDDNKIRLMVEEALQDQYGFRFEQFCHRFAHFCKLDYASGFLRHLIDDCALECEAASMRRDKVVYSDRSDQTEMALKTMAYRVCIILGRIVEEYGELVDGIHRTPVLLGVDFSKLMSKIDKRPETAMAICESLRRTPSRALSWITDEVGVWLYGG